MESTTTSRSAPVPPAEPMERLERARRQLWSLMDLPFMQQRHKGHQPLADLEEDDDEFRLDVELPGIDRDDITVEVEGRRIIVTGERKERARTGVVHRGDRVTGLLRHEVLLPADIEEAAIDATLVDGVLSIRLPKSEVSSRHRIDIK